MKIFAFSFLALAAVALVGYQHQQLGRLRAENITLQQSESEAAQLQADLAKFSGDAAQNEEEIARLREENRDLLKLRREVSELRDARAEFERVSAENKRLQSTAQNARQADEKHPSMQPITIRIGALYDRGVSTPENALQTFYWAQRDLNPAAMSRCVTSESWQRIQNHVRGSWQRVLDENTVSIEIAARRDLDPTTVQFGVQIHANGNPRHDEKTVITLVLQNGEWRVDIKRSNGS